MVVKVPDSFTKVSTASARAAEKPDAEVERKRGGAEIWALLTGAVTRPEAGRVRLGGAQVAAGSLAAHAPA